MQTGPTIQQFMETFPNDDACLEYLMHLRHGEHIDCPKCGKHGKFHRVRRHPAYECAWCGFEIFPMVGTPFHRSHVPLQKWFYAIYLFTTTRHGVPAKELQRQLGISYPSALRMAHRIREYMGQIDGDPPMTGHVELDEAYIGGRGKGFDGRSTEQKTPVFGMLERGGELYMRAVERVNKATLFPHIERLVPKGTKVSTDEWRAYASLRKIGYDHQVVRHAAKEYARGETHVNTLENVWMHLKRGIRGTHIHVSRKHLPKYLAEFEFRYNRRKRPGTMFAELLASL